jgi:putative transposase
MTSPEFSNPALFQQVLQRAASATFVDQLCREHGLKLGRGIYSATVVFWLMIYQRLNSKRTLSSAVQWLASNLSGLPLQSNACKRVRENRISTGTGGYCQARQKMPTLIVTKVTDHVFEQLQAQMREELPEVARPVVVIDGATLRLPHPKDLVREFPPGHNQHGDNHWPVMLMVTFHDVHTGLAARPSWGAMYGPRAVSEQELAQQSLERLPADAIVLADGNFGIFAFAHAVQQTQRPLLLRLTASRAQKVLGATKLRNRRRRKVVWESSSWDRKQHPGLPERALVQGWVVACRNPSRRDETLFFFTTLELKPARILALYIYKLRWNIETDLRSLKRTVGLHQVTSKGRAMVENEVLMAVAAYNVVRAVMCLAARRAGLTPRQLSFSAAQDAVMAAWPRLLRATTEVDYRRELDRLLQLVTRTKLPNRSGKRSYPRVIWGRGGHFPFRSSSSGSESSQ